ncbi:MAG: diphthamide biosynthesis enzyme Dph2 [Archaeoglobaceae archaeon]|nr:diphthamide biosynthesis enzyme Dph2 [Archaeoglobaceae archaeon]MCX8152531.1 diphthamide biosynthesis enzyme Dph2 [Archaeoglobaceae archaeon]MDW8014048.1 diphthamide biosynthesis enzyme Dph2 [Archaeoglobaceae archaeon]
MIVGIQLPDGLKRKAIEIARKFEEEGHEVIISADSCFGACDVDLSLLKEVDQLFHYAHTPLLKIGKVTYVPYFVDYDPEIPLKVEEKRIALVASTQYCHMLEKVKRYLEKLGYEVELEKGPYYLGQILGCNYSALKKCRAEAVLCITDGLFHGYGAAMYSRKKVYVYDPLSKVLKEVKADEFFKERFKQIARCVGKRSVGVLLSKKPGQKRKNLAFELKKKARNFGLEAFVVSIEDFSEEKLFNLPFEFYVNTACPRITYDDYKRFSKPILSPQEFEILLGCREELELDEIEKFE